MKSHFFEILAFSVVLVTGCKKDKDAPALAPPTSVDQSPLSLTFSVGVFACSAVAYNPDKKLYYIAESGHHTYPFQTLSSSGVQLSESTTFDDFRGMWWNRNTNKLEVNLAVTGGWGQPTLSDEGYGTTGHTSIFGGQHQPDAQSVGTFDYNNNRLMFYQGETTVYFYNRLTGAPSGTLELTGISLATVNRNTVIYTGVKGYELGLLDFAIKRVLFFNGSTGVFSGATQLPVATVTSGQYNFSYANGYVWTFNTAVNTWYSFKIF